MSKRVFIAINIPQVIINSIKNEYFYWRDELFVNMPLRWVGLDNLHVTILFVGEVTEDDISNIISKLSEIKGFGKIRCRLENIDYFGVGLAKKVLYIGLIENKLDRLVKVIKEKLLFLSSNNIDERPFHGHITLARFNKKINDQQNRKLEDIRKDYNGKKWGEWDVNKIVLFESVLGSGMPEYRVIKEFSII